MNKVAQITAVLSSAILLSCGGESHEAKKAEEGPAVRVPVAAVEELEWPSHFEALGTVRARTVTTLSSKVMGYVREVRAQAGDRVRAGQVLVVLDSRDLDSSNLQAQAGVNEAKSAMAEVDSAVAAANAQLELAQVTFKRMKDLYDKKSISDQEFDEATARLKLAQANHEMAKSKKAQLSEKIRQAEQGLTSAGIMKSYAELLAPFDGTITQRLVEPGVLASPGVPLLVVEQAGAYRLEANVEESRLPLVKVGQEVAVELDALEKRLQARISEIVPAVDAASRAFTVRINLPGMPRLQSGLFGRAKFDAAPRRVIAIPAEAVISRGQVQSAFVVDENRARTRLLTLGSARDGRVEVLSGLAVGDRLVYPAPSSLADGSRVEVAQ